MSINIDPQKQLHSLKHHLQETTSCFNRKYINTEKENCATQLISQSRQNMIIRNTFLKDT